MAFARLVFGHELDDLFEVAGRAVMEVGEVMAMLRSVGTLDLWRSSSALGDAERPLSASVMLPRIGNVIRPRAQFIRLATEQFTYMQQAAFCLKSV